MTSTRPVRFLRFARSPVAGMVLCVLCAIAYLPGLFTMPPVDRDESRFAQASRQMFEGVRDADSPAEVIEALAVPRIQDRPRLNKPPLIYWLQSVPAGLLGLDDPERDIGRDWFGGVLPTGNIGAFRLVSALCALLAVVFTWRLGLRLFEPRTAFVAAALLAICVMVLWDARQARADQLLLATTTASLWALAAAWQSFRRRAHVGWPNAIALWTAVGLGVLTKGPITPMVVVFGTLCLAWATGSGRFMRAVRPISGLAVVVGMALPWIAAVAWAQGGIGAYAGEVWEEVFVRAAGGKEHFVPVPGYHAVLLAVLFFPGSMLTLIGVVRAVRVMRGGKMRGHGRKKAEAKDPGNEIQEPVEVAGEGSGNSSHEQVDAGTPSLVQRFRAFVRGGWATGTAETFCLCMIVPTWLVFEATPAKLPHYTLPLYPLIALLTARALLSAAAGTLADVRTRGARFGFLLFALLCSVFLFGGNFLGIWLMVAEAERALPESKSFVDMFLTWPGVSMWVPMAMMVAVMVITVIWWKSSWVKSLFIWQPQAIVIALVLNVLVFGVWLPGLTVTWVSSQLIKNLEDSDVDLDHRQLFAYGYVEDSLIFLSRGNVERVNFHRACGWVTGKRGPFDLLLVGERSVLEDHGQWFAIRCEGRDWAPTGTFGTVKGLSTADGSHFVVEIYSANPLDHLIQADTTPSPPDPR